MSVINLKNAVVKLTYGDYNGNTLWVQNHENVILNVVFWKYFNFLTLITPVVNLEVNRACVCQSLLNLMKNCLLAPGRSLVSIDKNCILPVSLDLTMFV